MLREMFGEAIGQLPNELDDALSDPLVAIETYAGQLDELGHGVGAEAIERVQQAGTQAERVERSLPRHSVEAVWLVAALFIPPGRQVDRLEAGEPRAAHLLGAVEAGPVIPRQRLGEERGQRRAHRRVEPPRIEGDLLLHERGVGRAVPPSGQVPGGHLVQCHGRGEAFRVYIPARRSAQPQERVQVRGGACADVFRRRIRKREVEHDEGERLVRPAHGYADVVGLQVAMRYALLLQPLHDAQQLIPEALQQVERESAFLSNAIREGVRAALVAGAGHRHEERRVARQLHVAVCLDDVLMTQRAQHLALAPDAIVERRVEGHLEHAAAVIVLDLKRDGGGPFAEASFHQKSVLEHVAGAGIERMNEVVPRLSLEAAEELPFRRYELLEELRDGVGAPADVRVGRAFHDQLQGLGNAVHHVGELKPAHAQGRDRGRRRLIREQPVADGPERKDVELLHDIPALARLRRQIHVALVVARKSERRLRSGAPRARHARPPDQIVRPGMPVEYLELRSRSVRCGHQDLLRTQRTVMEAAFVRVLQRLRELAQQIEARREVQRAASSFEKVVQAFGRRIVLEDESRSRLRVGEQLHARDAIVSDAVEPSILPLRRALSLRACGPGRSLRERVDAHPPLRRPHRDVHGFPVLIDVGLEQEPTQQVVRHAPLSLRGMNPGLLHRARKRPGERPVDPWRRPARVEARVAAEDLDDARETARLGLARQVHAGSRPILQPAPYLHVREEYGGLDVRPALSGKRLLCLQEPGQLLRLPVREQERAVDQDLPAADLSTPRARVARDDATPALDLDQIDLVERHDEEIDFVDAPVFGDELEASTTRGTARRQEGGP